MTFDQENIGTNLTSKPEPSALTLDGWKNNETAIDQNNRTSPPLRSVSLIATSSYPKAQNYITINVKIIF